MPHRCSLSGRKRRRTRSRIGSLGLFSSAGARSQRRWCCRQTRLGGAAKRRGVQQAGEVLTSLDEFLAAPLFRDVGRLSVFPGDNQVLRRREGYRQLYAAWALIEGTVGLEVDLEDPLLVSRKSIATLYEYWTFIRLAGAVAEACGRSLHRRGALQAIRHRNVARSESGRYDTAQVHH